MKEIQYKDFSLTTHRKNWQINKPNVCQWEITFSCSLHCRHCYTDCYNKPPLIKKELSTVQIKSILDKLYDLGVIWLCFTGGDPLKRKDFLEIYAYAKDKGFIITIFTTGYSITEAIADYLEKKPPFAIEITVNSVSKEISEKITQVEDSYLKTIKGLNLILKKKLPLKVKTMATQDNFAELAKIKKFLETKGIKFRPSSILHARLNTDTAPCNLRLEPKEIENIDRLFEVESAKENDPDAGTHNNHKKKTSGNNRLFRCAAGEDGINLDPYGNMFLCNCIRKPAINFSQSSFPEIKKIFSKTFREISNLKFKTNSRCRNCEYIDLCLNCPGKSLLEKKNIEAPIEYFCKLAYFNKNRR